MSTTALQVFAKTMALMGLLDGSGGADTSDNLEYKNKTVPFLNLLLPECLPASDTHSATENPDGTYSRTIPAELTAVTDNLPLDDGICRGVLPYGLAAHFLLSEDDPSGKAAFYQQKYEENLALMRRTVPSVSEDIADLYGGGSISDGVSWS